MLSQTGCLRSKLHDQRERGRHIPHDSSMSWLCMWMERRIWRVMEEKAECSSKTDKLPNTIHCIATFCAARLYDFIPSGICHQTSLRWLICIKSILSSNSGSRRLSLMLICCFTKQKREDTKKRQVIYAIIYQSCWKAIRISATPITFQHFWNDL